MRRPVGLFASMFCWLPVAACATMNLNLAPEQADAPWTPATTSQGEIVAGFVPASGQPKSASYILPSNRELAETPSAASGLERSYPYTLPELINIAQSNNPTTRNAWNDARNAALAAGIAESTFLPLVSAGVVEGYQTSHNEKSALGTSGTYDFTANGNISVVSLQWLLFDFGERSALV